MENEIPAGTKVKVDGQDAEVLAHVDGAVHVSINGEAVTVQPSQVQLIDAPAAQNQTHDESTSAAESGEAASGS